MQTDNNPRVALSKILVLAEYLQTRCGVSKSVANEISEIEQVAKAALAEPIRNCDVGTAEEQSRRFCAFCRPRTEPCDGCACLEGSRKGRCEFAWGQMPCEEGGAK